jgi:hypothetical protein
MAKNMVRAITGGNDGFEIIGRAGRKITFQGYQRESVIKKARWLRRGL